ncbi:succinyldiaminopimelate transaminase [Corynebacterium sp. TAE3-ERU12]|uniref:succinyldiaminopimelate transaminase n=1 Tax=Corynebacterium sp. TAE3-ERU12 TaxID=2849491 RepID=UPI001C4721DB|nr:succinyldiaminopimelate transaminase [Corynebacterium sp. TAE3-ERU12]MBV7295046.1 succinyldiaminopimelate transaminase [Corynebacterium sp. TAE3-ERU12]
MPRPPRVPADHRLPAFPWDSLADAKATAQQHPDGMVDLSVGTPVDPVADSIQKGLADGAAAPGYPQTIGTAQLRQALTDAMTRRYRTIELDPDSQVLPVVGTKEAIAWLPFILGIGEGHTIVIPELAYPTYEVGARLSGADFVRADSTLQLGPSTPTLMYLNSPANPSGKVLGVEHLRKVVSWARERDVIIASDECYLGLSWDQEAVSILDPRVCDGDTTNLLAIHSLSKTSNLASYRAGWFAGDPKLISELLETRRHAGLMMPGPVQQAMIVALGDDAQEREQRRRYARRRELLRAALLDSGFTIDDSDGGLYLWVSRGIDCRETVDWFAERGVLVAPGDFYGPKGHQHVRIGLTATDEKIEAAASRIAADN